MRTTRPPFPHLLLVVLLLLAAFVMISLHLGRESLWHDEAWSLWAVRGDGLRGTLDTLRIVMADVHPPLYFLLLDVWVGLAGESVYAVRLLSALGALVGLAATYAAGRRLLNRGSAAAAVLLLGTAPFFVYYARETRMYALLLVLAALATWAYAGWLAQPGVGARAITAGRLRWLRGLLRGSAFAYVLCAATLLYTHYAGVLLLLSHALHLLLAHPRRFGRYLRLLLGVALLFAPWLPFLLRQVQSGGLPASAPLPTNWLTLEQLLLIVTTGYPALFAGALALGLLRRWLAPAETRFPASLALLLLWLLLTPLALLLLNAVLPPLYQVRYLYAALPAGALLLAGALFGGRRAAANPYLRLVGGGLLLALVGTQVFNDASFFPPRPDYGTAAARMAAARDSLHPALIDFTPQSPFAYYARHLPLRTGITIDLSWRWFDTDELRAIAERVAGAPSVWLVLSAQTPRLWDALLVLVQGRTVGYRDAVEGTLLYRLDRAVDSAPGFGVPDSALSFVFADANAVPLLAYAGAPLNQLYALAGERLCFDAPLRALVPLADGAYRAEIRLTQGYNTTRASLTVPLPALAPGESVPPQFCLDIPAEVPAGPHHLRLAVRPAAAGHPLHLLEGPDTLYWGQELIFAAVSVVVP